MLNGAADIYSVWSAFQKDNSGTEYSYSQLLTIVMAISYSLQNNT